MGLFDRIRRVVAANANDLVSKAEDPEKILEQALIEMQDNLVQLRQAVAGAIASQKRLEQQYNAGVKDADEWYRRAQLALQKGDESLAKQALAQKKTKSDSAAVLKVSLDNAMSQSETLRKNLTALEGKIAEAKTKKDMLKARAQAAKAQEQLQGALAGVNTTSAMAAFERMEEKVLQGEAKSAALAELAGSNLESQFAQLESSDVDDELALLKASMTGALPPVSKPNPLELPAAAQEPVDKSASQ